MRTVDSDDELNIPKELLRCPICKSALVPGSPEAWTQDDEGRWYATEIPLSCETEPAIDHDDWEEWHKGHHSMPYVDWLPVEQRILQWIKKHYRFNLY